MIFINSKILSSRSNQIADSKVDFSGELLANPFGVKKHPKSKNHGRMKPSSIFDILNYHPESNTESNEQMMSGSPYGSHSLLMMETRKPQGFHSSRPKMSQTIPFQLINSRLSWQKPNNVASLTFPALAMNNPKSRKVVPNSYQQSRIDENGNQNEDPFSVSYDITLGEDDFQNEVLHV